MNLYIVLYITFLIEATKGDHVADKRNSFENINQPENFQIKSSNDRKQLEIANNSLEDQRGPDLTLGPDRALKLQTECPEGACFPASTNNAVRRQIDSRTGGLRRKYKNLIPYQNMDFVTALRVCNASISELVGAVSQEIQFPGETNAALTSSARSFEISRSTIEETFQNLAPYYLPKPSKASRIRRLKDVGDLERVSYGRSTFSNSNMDNGHGRHFENFDEINTAFTNMRSPLVMTSSQALKTADGRHFTSKVEEPMLAETMKRPPTTNGFRSEKNFQDHAGSKMEYNKKASMTSKLSHDKLRIPKSTKQAVAEVETTQSKMNFDKTTKIASLLQNNRSKLQQRKSKQQDDEQETDHKSLSNARALSSECDQAVAAMYDAFTANPVQERDVAESLHDNLWHLKFMDSWGKAGDGVLMGNLRSLGLMEECLRSKGFYTDQTSNKIVNFTGQYCTVSTAVRLKNFGLQGWVPSVYGTCMPSTCTATELMESVNETLSQLNYAADDVWCRQQDANLPWETWDYVGCSVIGVMVLMVVMATVAHAAVEKIPKAVQAFSMIENYRKISTVKMDSTGQITCFYGIRVLSICWIILGHQYAYMSGFGYNLLMMSWMTQDWAFQIIWTGYKAVDTFFTIGGLLATQAIVKMDFLGTSKLKIKSRSIQTSNVQDEAPKIVTNSPVDIVSPTDENRLEMREIDFQDKQDDAEAGNSIEKSDIANKSAVGAHVTDEASSIPVTDAIVNFLKTYVVYVCHRLMRLLPTMFLIVMFCAGPSSFLVDGPNRRRYEGEYILPCRTNWWVDLTLFSNVIFRVTGEKADKDPDYGPVDSCISHSWYLAVDFQLYLIAPFILLPLKYHLKNYGVWYLSFVSLVFCLVPGIIVSAKDLLPAMLITLDEKATLDYSRKVYMMPYTRAAPYFLGGIAGLLLLQSRAPPPAGSDKTTGEPELPSWQRLLENKAVRAAGWVVFVVSFSAVMFGLCGSNEVSLDVHQLSDAASFFYASFASAAWAICVCWVVMLCALRLADPLNDFLSHPFWQVPCRISYPVYLISLPVQKWVFYSLLAEVYLSHLTIALSYCGILVISFMAAFCISIVAEAPYIALSKLIFTTSAKKRD